MMVCRTEFIRRNKRLTDLFRNSVLYHRTECASCLCMPYLYIDHSGTVTTTANLCVLLLARVSKTFTIRVPFIHILWLNSRLCAISCSCEDQTLTTSLRDFCNPQFNSVQGTMHNVLCTRLLLRLRGAYEMLCEKSYVSIRVPMSSVVRAWRDRGVESFVPVSSLPLWSKQWGSSCWYHLIFQCPCFDISGKGVCRYIWQVLYF